MSETENPEVLGTDRKTEKKERESTGRAGKRRGDPGCAR